MKNVKVTGKCYFDNCKINAKYKCIDQNLYCLKHKNEVIKKNCRTFDNKLWIKSKILCKQEK